MPTLDEVKSQLLKTILADKKNAAWQDWLSRARVAAKVSVLSGMEATTTTTDPRSAMPTTTVVPMTGTPPAGPTTSPSN